MEVHRQDGFAQQGGEGALVLSDPGLDMVEAVVALRDDEQQPGSHHLARAEWTLPVQRGWDVAVQRARHVQQLQLSPDDRQLSYDFDTQQAGFGCLHPSFLRSSSIPDNHAEHERTAGYDSWSLRSRHRRCGRRTVARYNRLLVANTASPLVDALVEATAAANREVRLLSLERSHWEELLPEIRGTREGRRQWSDAQRGDTARVCLHWWTDPIGRRHYRIIAGNSRDGSYRQLSSIASDPRPPLWHVHPERVFHCQRDGHDAWLVVCGCGVAGEPDVVGWMGLHCAACHDRLEEGQPPVPVVAPAATFKHHGGERSVLTFSPDGRWLVTLEAPAVDIADVCLVEVATGKVRGLPTPSTGRGRTPQHPPSLRDGPHAVAFSPDGRLLGYTEGPTRLLVRNLQTGVVELDEEVASSLVCAGFSPDGQTLVTTGTGELRLWRRQEEKWRPVTQREFSGTALAFTDDGRRLAVVGPECLTLFDVLFDELVEVAREERANNRPARDLAFTGDCKELVYLASFDGTLTAMLGQMEGLPYGSEILTYAVEPGRLVLKAQRELRGGGMADLSPDG